MATALKLARKPVIDALIEEAGREQALATAHGNRYKSLRKEIENILEIPEGETSVERIAGGFRAKLFYPKHIRVVPENLVKVDKDLFWRTVKVAVKDVKDILSREDFFFVTEEDQSNSIPQLDIGKAPEGE